MTALEKAARASYAHARSHAPHWPEWEAVTNEDRDEWTNNARAVLTAVREPDAPARTSGAASLRSMLPGQYADGPIAGRVYTTMIDAILSEGQP
jgi:hypothetical protein